MVRRLEVKDGPQNSWNYAAEREDSPFDVRHRFVGFVRYALPIGKGKALLNGNGIAPRIAGGWRVNSIVTLRESAPFSVQAPYNSGSGSNHDSRADCSGDP